MARNNTLSGTFSLAAGDGASGFSESLASVSFTSAEGIKLEGSIGTSEVEYDLATDYGITQADGIYFENRDTTNFVILSLRTATGSGANVSTLAIAPGGCFMVRCDTSQAAIDFIAIQADTAACTFVLCIAE